jgi:hypothetical protein
LVVQDAPHFHRGKPSLGGRNAGVMRERHIGGYPDGPIGRSIDNRDRQAEGIKAWT